MGTGGRIFEAYMGLDMDTEIHKCRPCSCFFLFYFLLIRFYCSWRNSRLMQLTFIVNVFVKLFTFSWGSPLRLKVRAGVEMAIIDAAANSIRVPLWRLFGGASNTITTDITVKFWFNLKQNAYDENNFSKIWEKKKSNPAYICRSQLFLQLKHLNWLQSTIKKVLRL